MSGTIRYHVLAAEGHGRVAIFDVQTGKVQHPSCWQDIAAYYHYLLGRGRMDEAQGLLAESMAGSQPMTRMVQRMQGMAQPAAMPH